MTRVDDQLANHSPAEPPDPAAVAADPEIIPLPILLKNIEVFAWATLTMCPVLRLINGPAVATDQAVMRGAVAVVAGAVAIGTTFYRVFLNRRESV